MNMQFLLNRIYVKLSVAWYWSLCLYINVLIPYGLVMSSGPRLNINTVFPRMDFHDKDKTVIISL